MHIAIYSADLNFAILLTHLFDIGVCFVFDLSGFPTFQIMLSENKNSFISLSILYVFNLLSCLASRAILTSSAESGHRCFAHDLSGTAFIFSQV